jgi:TRAP-type C4-dicarboxylate transport system substrate-binding protein
MPKGMSLGASLEWFAEEFPKRTDGRYKVETYPSNTLLPIPAILDSLKGGVAEIALAPPPMWATAFPVTMLCTMPTVAFPSGTMELAQKQWDAWWEFYNTFPEVQSEFKDFKLLWPYALGASQFMSKDKDFHKASDFNGMAVGGASGPIMEIVKANGGAEVSLMMPEVYMNLEKGVITGAFCSFGMSDDYNYQEICKYWYAYDFSCGILTLLMNKEAWNAISAADQKILEETIKESNPIAAQASIDGVVSGRQKWLDAGRIINEPTPDEIAAWQVDCQPALKAWITSAKDAGVKDPEGILERYRQLWAKYVD